jgi:quercetin dioxygenase-like cupin family protein
MPFYKILEMEAKKSSSGPAMAKSVAGELMKAGVVTYQDGEGPTPHFHPNEEQYMLMIEGKLNMILGDEEQIIEKGDMVHIPRNTRHGVVAVGGPAVFFAVKSPCGDGNLDQDYNRAGDADEVMGRLKRGRAGGA